jgi:hypothetical protein
VSEGGDLLESLDGALACCYYLHVYSQRRMAWPGLTYLDRIKPVLTTTY